jgi:chaperone modulatory protein CbpM
MRASQQKVIVIDESCFTLSLKELTEYGSVSADYILELVDQGILDVVDQQNENILFRADTAARLQKLLRLQQQLELNLPGAAVALDLMDEIDRLHAQVAQLEAQIARMTATGC